MRGRLFITTAMLTLTLATAEGQYTSFNRFRNAYYSTNPYAGGYSPYNFGYNYSYGFNYVNPATGGATSFQFNQGYNSTSPFGLPGGVVGLGGLGGYGGYGGYTNPYLSGLNGYNGGVNPIAAEQARLARLAALAGGNRNGFNPPPAPNPVPPKVAVPAPRPAMPEPEVADPESIRSGDAINVMIPKITALLDAGNRTESPLIPADLIKSLHYTPGAAADLLNLLGDGTADAPAVFDAPELAPVKAELLKHAEPLAKAVTAAKPTSTSESEKLAAAVQTARPKVEAATKTAARSDRDAAIEYLDGLAALAKVDSTAELKRVYNPTFAVVGGSAVDYARYFEKHKLRLAPAPASSVSAYEALYRALNTTKTALEKAAR